MTGDVVGSAVLVHGLWGNPADWLWVRTLLEEKGVQVVTPDLPSHRSTDAGSNEDAEEVRSAIRACRSPVVVVGWSYGGSIISVAAAGEDVSHLIYVSDIPKPAEEQDHTLSWISEDPHILLKEDGTFVLANDWWLNEEAGTSFPAAVREHLRRNPRRPVSSAIVHRQEAAAWETIRTTVILGRNDEFFTEADYKQSAQDFTDFQLLDTDHFLIFRRPAVVSSAVLKALREELSQ